jgi:hypothetical protein
VLSLLTSAVLAPGVVQFLAGLAISLGALAAGVAIATVPEGTLVFPFFILAILVVRVRWVLDHALRWPLLTVAGAVALAILCLGAAFSARSFRWASLSGGPPPLFAGWAGRYHSWLDIWRTLPWWPARRVRLGREADRRSASRAYADTVVRRVIGSFGAVTPSKRILLATLGLSMAAYLVVFTRVLPRAGTEDGTWILLPMAGLATGVRMNDPSRASLPWSRDDHLVVTWIRDITKTLWFLLATGPLVVVLGWAGGWNGWGSAGAAARAIAGIGIVFPLAQWGGGPPIGGARRPTGEMYVLSFGLTVAFVIVPMAMVRGLAAIAQPAWVQTLMLGGLLVASQALHWYGLRRYYALRDLAGEPE